MKRGFEELSYDGVCDVCGKNAKVVVCASSMGAISFAYFRECLSKEPYSAIIGCYSSLGLDERENFYEKNRHLMEYFYMKSKDNFLYDCDKAEKEYDAYMRGGHLCE